MPRLIRVFAGRTLILLVLSCRGSYCENRPGKGTCYPTWYRWLEKKQNKKKKKTMRWKIELLQKRVGFSGSNWKKKRSLFRAVKISKNSKRGTFSDNTAKRVVFTETRNTLFRVLSSILCSSTCTQSEATHPTWGTKKHNIIIVRFQNVCQATQMFKETLTDMLHFTMWRKITKDCGIIIPVGICAWFLLMYRILNKPYHDKTTDKSHTFPCAPN